MNTENDRKFGYVKDGNLPARLCTMCGIRFKTIICEGCKRSDINLREVVYLNSKGSMVNPSNADVKHITYIPLEERVAEYLKCSIESMKYEVEYSSNFLKDRIKCRFPTLDLADHYAKVMQASGSTEIRICTL